MPLDRPDRFEILDAVTALLDDQVKSRVDGALGYDVRIAIHLLRLLRRELELAPAHEAEERERLRALVPDADEGADLHRELCARIRDGRLAHDDPALRAHLVATTMAKVAIDQPKYATYLARLRS